jgi:hypothetical protein
MFFLKASNESLSCGKQLALTTCCPGSACDAAGEEKLQAAATISSMSLAAERCMVVV